MFGVQQSVEGEDGQGRALVPITQGVVRGKVSQSYRPGKGGIFVFDDGDIEDELGAEGEAYCALAEMPELGEDDDEDLDESDDEVAESEVGDDDDEERIPDSAQPGQKRKSSSQEEEDSQSDADEGTPRKRRRSNSVCIT